MIDVHVLYLGLVARKPILGGAGNSLLSYVIVIPWAVRGDNPRASASGLFYVQSDKHGITILYHLHQCRPFTSREYSC